jgi:SulP family sulfate permease
MAYRFNRLELAGSLGDLGVLLPMAVSMILINHLPAQGVFLSVGLYYLASGMYFGVTTPVQPMKVIGSYAIGMGLAASDIYAAGLCVGLLLLVIGLTNSMKRLGRFVPRPAIRGIQLATGTLLVAQGVRLALGTTTLQRIQGVGEPFLAVQSIGPVPVNWILGAAALLLTLYFLTSKRVPAALVTVAFGIVSGIVLGAATDAIAWAPALPSILPDGFPSWASLATAVMVLALPQLPMTLGNAVIANEDLARDYFGDEASRTTGRALCVSMGLANVGSFLLGGMPMCHGAGGLAAHYRFGARTAGSNVMIGLLFVVLALGLGETILPAMQAVPLSVLGVLLVFAGSQLTLTILDVKDRKDMFVVLLVLGATLASNLAVGFVLGAALHHLLRSDRLHV